MLKVVTGVAYAAQDDHVEPLQEKRISAPVTPTPVSAMVRFNVGVV